MHEASLVPSITSYSYQTDTRCPIQETSVIERFSPAKNNRSGQVFIHGRSLAGETVSQQVRFQTSSPPYQIQQVVPEARHSQAGQDGWQPIINIGNCNKKQCYLPPPHEGSSLLKEYLHDYNSRIPLFHPETIYSHVQGCYSGSKDATPLTWFLTYIVFGIGHRLRAVSLFAAADDNINADWYLNKCLAFLPDLLVQKTTLPLVQALLGVSVLLQTSKRWQKASLFISTAMRMALSLSCNEDDPSDNEECLTKTQEIYVFWIAFYMDTAMNLSSNQPTTQKLVDIGVPLPANSTDLVLNASYNEVTIPKLSVFSLHTTLSLIQAEASEELFSVKARRRPAAATATAFEIIASKLHAWRISNPLSGPDAMTMLGSMYISDVIHSITLEASYFGTLYQIHAVNSMGVFSPRVDAFSPETMKSGVGNFCSEVYTDAQKLLEFAGMISFDIDSFIW